MSDLSDRERMQLMRMMLVAAQTMIIVNNVADISVSVPVAINVNSTAQNFEGWGTSLAWFGEYVGGLEGVDGATSCILLFCVSVKHPLCWGIHPAYIPHSAPVADDSISTIVYGLQTQCVIK